MLFAEELLLLALDPDSGKAVNGSQQPLRVALTGALVAELGQAGLVTVNEQYLTPRPGTADDPLLADTLAAVGENARRSAPKSLRRVERALGGSWPRVGEALAHGGVVRAQARRVLFVPTAPRYPVVRPDVRDEVVARLQAAAAGDGELDPRTAAVLALAGPARLLEVVAPSRSGRRHARQRIALADKLTPVARVVRKVISEQQAVTNAGVVAATGS